jgi:UDP-2,4-diacetamido-2,4,6-trideoxy-beta-L-altropyranose hydrolase
MRSLALSEELTKRGNACYFYSKIEDDQLIKKIENVKAKFQKIKDNLIEKEDLKNLIKFSNEKNTDWIITDCYKINSNYIKELKSNGFNVLSIDDTAQIHYHSDIVINQNVGAEKLDFSSEKYTKLLLGPKYVMMRKELLKVNKKIVKKDVKNILISIGGSDKDNFTLKILKLLEQINNDARFLVITGPFNPFYNDLEKYIRESDSKIKLIKSPKDMSKIYLESDIAISAGGSTCYELAYFGIPNIIVTIADNQIKIAQELDKQKVSIYIGKKEKLKEKLFKEKTHELINNYSLRKSMSNRGKKLVDGKGKERIVDFMESFN